jgi:hypothetical protein
MIENKYVYNILINIFILLDDAAHSAPLKGQNYAVSHLLVPTNDIIPEVEKDPHVTDPSCGLHTHTHARNGITTILVIPITKRMWTTNKSLPFLVIQHR